MSLKAITRRITEPITIDIQPARDNPRHARTGAGRSSAFAPRGRSLRCRYERYPRYRYLWRYLCRPHQTLRRLCAIPSCRRGTPASERHAVRRRYVWCPRCGYMCSCVCAPNQRLRQLFRLPQCRRRAKTDELISRSKAHHYRENGYSGGTMMRTPKPTAPIYDPLRFPPITTVDLNGPKPYCRYSLPRGVRDTLGAGWGNRSMDRI